MKDAHPLNDSLSKPAVVNDLPPEMLQKIFACLQGVIEAARGKWTSDRPHHWIRVTHVSRRWRASALDAKSLWTYVLITSHITNAAALGNLFLQRSHPLPINFEDVREPWDERPRPIDSTELEALHDYLIHNPQRLKGLNIKYPYPAKIWTLLYGPLPNLATADLQFERDSYDIDDLAMDGHPMNTLLQGCISSLRKLSINEGPLSLWIGTRFQSLTHLSVRQELFEPTLDLKTFPLFLKGLANTLEELELHYAAPLLMSENGLVANQWM